MNRVGTGALIAAPQLGRQIAVYFLHVTYRLMNLKFLK